MRKRLAALAAMTTALSALGLVTAAHAGVMFIPYGNQPAGATPDPLAGTLFTGSNLPGTFFTVSDPDVAAAPEFSTGPDTAPFLVVEGGNETETLALLAPAWHVDIYVGSLDSYNTISFDGPGAALPTLHRRRTRSADGRDRRRRPAVQVVERFV